jgi:hypothetical protein
MDNSNDNNSQWKKIYLDMGVNNEKELQHKLNKSTADRIFKNLKNENIDLNEIYEVICIGCYWFAPLLIGLSYLVVNIINFFNLDLLCKM